MTNKFQIIIQCDDEAGLRAAVDQLTTRGVDVTPTTEAPAATPIADTSTLRAVDETGFPFNTELHQESRELKANGEFKVKRGKGDEEKAARIAWQSAGGDAPAPVVAPAPVAERNTPTLPGAPGLPGAPVAAPAVAPVAVVKPPVTLDEMFARAGEVMTAELATAEQFNQWYLEITGRDANTCMEVFALEDDQGAAARRALMDKMEELTVAS